MDPIAGPVFAASDAKGWEERFTTHPCWAWLWEFEKLFDFGNLKEEGHERWLTEDFEFTNPFGVTTVGREAAWGSVKDTYQFFIAHYHEPLEFIIWETDKGWKLMGKAFMYVKFPGEAPGDQVSVSDLNGRTWDYKFPGKFTFEWVKDPAGPNGIKMKRQDVTADGFPMFNELVKRKIVTFEHVAEMMKERSGGH